MRLLSNVSLCSIATLLLVGGFSPAQELNPRASLGGRFVGIIKGVAFSPDGKLVAVSDDVGAFKLFETATGKEVATLKEGTDKVGGVWSLSFSPDGKTLAGGDFEGAVQLWEVAGRRHTATLSVGKKTAVMTVAFSSDGKLVAAGYLDATVRIWEVATRKELQSFTGNVRIVTEIAFSPDGKTLVVAGGERLKPGTVKLWDVATGKESLALAGHTGQVTAVAFSPDGKMLATGAETFAFEKNPNLKLWNVQTGKEVVALKGHWGLVSVLAFAPDGKTLISVSAGDLDYSLRQWDVTTGNELSKRTGFVFIARPFPGREDAGGAVSECGPALGHGKAEG